MAVKLSFAGCTLDQSTRELHRDGKIVPLEPKVYDLLDILVQRRPAVVTNEELDELLWPKVYVARGSLARLVSELRAALGDDRNGVQIIRTVYKTGYAFSAEATSISIPAVGASRATTELIWNGKVLLLTEGEHTAGRDPSCSLVVEAGSVSRLHARVRVAAGVATVEDLGSTNGTYVNALRIAAPTKVSPGDVVSLGGEVLQLRRRMIAATTVVFSADSIAARPPPK